MAKIKYLLGIFWDSLDKPYVRGFMHGMIYITGLRLIRPSDEYGYAIQVAIMSCYTAMWAIVYWVKYMNKKHRAGRREK